MFDGDTHHTRTPSSTPHQAQLARRLLKELRQQLGFQYIAFVLAVSSFGLVQLLPAQLFRYFTESIQNIQTLPANRFLFHLVGFGLMVSVALLISSIGSTLCYEWLRLKVEMILKKRILQRLHEISLNVLDGSQRGDWITRMTGDLSRVEIFLTEDIPFQIRQFAVLIGSGALFYYHSGWLALVPIGTALGLTYLNLIIQKRLAPVLTELRMLQGSILHVLIESLEGIRTIRSHKAEPFVQRRFERKLVHLSSKSMRSVRGLAALMGGTEFVGKIMVTFCLTAVGLAMSRGSMTLEHALVYPFFIGLFYGSAQSVANAAYEWNRFQIEGGRLAEILYDAKTDEWQKSVPIEPNLDRVDSLRLRELVVGHHSTPLAEPFDFGLKTGELFCVMGPSGSGKSTLLETLAGLRSPLGGSLEVYDREHQLNFQSTKGLLPQFCSYVEQHPYIFEGSVRDNLTFGNKDRFSDSILWDVLEQAGLYELIQRRGGLSSILFDRGKNLSEGERYRLALGRALLLSRPFLLLDEPFAALDTRSIELVIEIMKKQLTFRGILVVTHFLPEGLPYNGIIEIGDFTKPETTLSQLGQAPMREETTLSVS